MFKYLTSVLFLVCFTIALGYPYSAQFSSSFEKSPNAYGWYYGYNRKVQTNYDPSTGVMVGSLYRELNPTNGTGTIGGMVGVWGTSLISLNTSVYESSIYQSEGNLPGGRYPYVSEFINGYCFGIFNDFDTASGSTGSIVSQPMFTVADATWGYDWSEWSVPVRVESTDSASVVPNAWNGTGDVVYDPVSEYYYWTQAWKEGQTAITTPVSCVVGRTKIPWDTESWEWSDYKDLRFDLDNIIDKYSDVSLIGPFHFSYAKDIFCNGTGKGIGVAVTDPDSAGILQLSYIYTNNWGLDWNKTPLGLHHQPVSELFDWVGESLTLTDSIGYNLDSLKIVSGTGAIEIDYARIMWDISVLTTEENIVHVLCMVFPASSEYPNCIFPWTDSGFRAGYYDIRGEITDTGVNWQNAVFIANPVDNEKGWDSRNGGIEFVSDINRTLSLSYAGNGNVFAAWLDKPVTRAVLNYEIQDYNFYDDGYLIISLDNGNTWETKTSVPINTGIPEDPVWYLKYAENVTKISSILEEGWVLSNHGYDTGNTVITYAASQIYDPVNSIASLYTEYERFLHIWKVTYTKSGIEPEEISIATDFELYQNYPNPFNPATEIKFALSTPSEVKLSVYNSNGQLVKTLFNGKKNGGLHSVLFNADEFNSGIYFYQLYVNGNTQNKKMVLVK